MGELLRTDGYKFSMAEAGFPLRRETFYLSFRRGGWQYVPFDLEEEVRRLFPPAPEADGTRDEWLARFGYATTLPMLRALQGDDIEIRAVPAHSWVYEREPIVTITGPSFAVSWLEPLVLRLFYPLQLATICATTSESDFDRELLTCTCFEQADLATRVLEAVYGPGSLARLPVSILTDHYVESVAQVAVGLLSLLKDPSRIFEVGMRSATCNEQHRLCLEVLRKLGIENTSDVEAARESHMRPVGTMGHEHVQRWGTDLDAYRAMRDQRVGVPTYLSKLAGNEERHTLSHASMRRKSERFFLHEELEAPFGASRNTTVSATRTCAASSTVKRGNTCHFPRSRE